jgi:putative restriction endonuclease
LDLAIRANKLQIGTVETDTPLAIVRRRKGQDRLRRLVTDYYGHHCAVCDVDDTSLLVASHIVGWAEAPAHRGDLTNVICLCRIHDPLFERGYWSLSDELAIVTRPGVTSRTIRRLLGELRHFRPPSVYPPSRAFVESHRSRFGFGG